MGVAHPRLWRNISGEHLTRCQLITDRACCFPATQPSVTYFPPDTANVCFRRDGGSLSRFFREFLLSARSKYADGFFGVPRRKLNIRLLQHCYPDAG
jgi:hypothetical protein